MSEPILDAHILISMTYISRANHKLSDQEIGEILQQAQDNNAAKSITGMLVFKDNIFLQTIEGSRALINSLMSTLINDKRHYDLQILETRELEHREWSRWSMNYASSTKENVATYLKYSTTANFNPYVLSFNSVRGLMRDLSHS